MVRGIFGLLVRYFWGVKLVWSERDYNLRLAGWTSEKTGDKFHLCHGLFSETVVINMEQAVGSEKMWLGKNIIYVHFV